MPRLFIGIDLPDVVDAHLGFMTGGIHGARWEGAENLHLTVRFLGDVGGGTARQIGDRLAEVDRPAFDVELAGVGVFPLRGRPPRIIWAGVEEPEALFSLRTATGRALQGLDLELDARKYHPHVTLARLRRAPEKEVASYVAQHSLLRLPPFRVTEFQLYSSVLTPSGAKYKVEEAFGLDDEAGRD